MTDLETVTMDAKTRLAVGDKIRFVGEKQRYTVRAVGGNFAICTKPFNPKRTVIYSILDFNQGIRGPNDCVFNPYDYAKQEDIDRCMKDLLAGEVAVSHRNGCPILVEDGE